jgi:hypothetical protein
MGQQNHFVLAAEMLGGSRSVKPTNAQLCQQMYLSKIATFY